MRIGIVGGGIAGLSTASALLRHGVEASVFEQAPALGEVGAGVVTSPNSARLLARIGLSDRLADVGASFDDNSAYYRMDGQLIAPYQTTDSAGNGPMYGMHRADLLELLASCVPSSQINTGHLCTGAVQRDDSVVLEFANGSSAQFDIVIAADGLRSLLRAQVSPPSDPVHSGSLAFRGLVPADRLGGWPSAWQVWMGDRKHFLTYPVRGGELIAYIAFVPTEEEQAESWSAPGDVEVLRAAFEGWDPRVGALLAEVDDTYWWGLYDREPLDRWTAGRIVLIGDAAHPMLPHLGQGANLAIEDAFSLAYILSNDESSVLERLESFEDLRKPRAHRVQDEARRNGRRYDSQDDYADLSRRDSEIAASADFRKWLYDYDADAAASEHVKRGS